MANQAGGGEPGSTGVGEEPAAGIPVAPVGPEPTVPPLLVTGAPQPATATRQVPVTRAGRVWVAIIVSIVLLALLLVFIFQNLDDARIHFFTANGSFPLALALLIAAIGGALIVLLVGSIRILQLRRTVRASKARAAAPAAPPPPS